jgi:hypothetical protein
MRQLMNLKTRGRFLEETRIFDCELHQLPRKKSQKIVVSHLYMYNY